jgi:hypothetical protein
MVELPPRIIEEYRPRKADQRRMHFGLCVRVNLALKNIGDVLIQIST